MRVSSGELRNRTLYVPAGRAFRPTPGRVKEALFSILSERIAQARVLDLFAGSGALGFEALSRGAAMATFVESDARRAERIRTAAAEFGMRERVTVLSALAERAAKFVEGPFDLVFADPPFDAGPPQAALAALLGRGALAADGLVVYERSGRSAAAEIDGLVTTRNERYGDVTLQFMSPA